MPSSNETVTDPFGSVDTGGFSDIDVQWTNARFGTNPLYTNDTGDMIPVFIVDVVNEDGDVREDQLFSIGKALEIVEGVARVDYTNPKHREKGGFGTGTKMQAILDTALSVATDQLTARYEETGLVPRDAGFWEGFSFHYVEEEKTFGKKGDERTYKSPKVSVVYGWEGLPGEVEEAKPKAKPAKAAAKKAGATKPKPTPPQRPAATDTPAADGAVENVYGLSDEVFAVLVEIASRSDDHFAFMAEAYEVDAIVEDGVQECVDDEAGLYAAAKA